MNRKKKIFSFKRDCENVFFIFKGSFIQNVFENFERISGGKNIEIKICKDLSSISKNEFFKFLFLEY